MNPALTETHRYCYSKLETLKTIRLLALLPGDPDDPLHGVILHYSGNTSPTALKMGYIALSYVWGGDEKSSLLHTVQGDLPITASLDSALRAVRPSAEGMNLDDEVNLYWIDAICIHQEDNVEKAEQVRQMREIYANAAFVTAYLGEEEEGIDEVLHLLSQLAKVNPKDVQSYNDYHQWDKMLDIVNERGTTESGLPFGTDPAWEGIRALFRRPWFRRVWIIQEFVVARYVVLVCGRKAIPWELLSSAVPAHGPEWAPLATYGFLDEETKSATFEGIRAWQAISYLRKAYQEGQRLTFINLAAILGRALATKARDHYFALLGLASDTESQRLDPDYDEAFEKIVRRYGAYFIERDNNLTQLYYSGLNSDPRFPSWTPDWTKAHRAPLGITNYCHAGGETKTNAHYDSVEDVLQVSGGCVDEITEVGEVHGLSDVLATATESLGALFGSVDALVQSWNTYPNGEETPQVVAKTLIFNGPFELVNVAYQLLRQVVRCAAAENIAFSRVLDQLAIPLWGVGLRELAYRKDWEPYFARVLKSMENQRLFTTRRGYLGVGTVNVQVGDSIHIFYGAKTPFVLRKSSLRQNTSRLICSCYVHGLMNGEGMAQKYFREEQVRLY